MTEKSDERELVRQAQGGDYSAFEKLAARYEDRLYTMAMNILRDPPEAEDATQAALLQALSHLREFRGEASFGTWLTRIGLNAALKARRREREHGETSLDRLVAGDEAGLIPHPEYIADWRGDPARLVEANELQRLLDEAAAALPAGQRLVFLLRDIQGLSVRETAAVLGISAANVKVRLLRARLFLRERLTRLFGDEGKRPAADHGHGDGEKETPAERLLAAYREREDEA